MTVRSNLNTWYIMVSRRWVIINYWHAFDAKRALPATSLLLLPIEGRSSLTPAELLLHCSTSKVRSFQRRPLLTTTASLFSFSRLHRRGTVGWYAGEGVGALHRTTTNRPPTYTTTPGSGGAHHEQRSIRIAVATDPPPEDASGRWGTDEFPNISSSAQPSAPAGPNHGNPQTVDYYYYYSDGGGDSDDDYS
jgi:hypothetical protein